LHHVRCGANPDGRRGLDNQKRNNRACRPPGTDLAETAATRVVMNVWIQRIASLKVAVALLVLIVCALAGATIVESAHGTESAMRTVYGTAWFRLLLAPSRSTFFSP